VHGLNGVAATNDREADGQTNGRLRTARDRIGAQLDDVSGLYWYTDLELARRRRGAPAGRSCRCACSADWTRTCRAPTAAFFRVALYANVDVSRLLRQAFVLHWGVGAAGAAHDDRLRRRAQARRTITGNSLHWILIPTGTSWTCCPVSTGPARSRGRWRPRTSRSWPRRGRPARSGP
jgi:hypothetical protein